MNYSILLLTFLLCLSSQCLMSLILKSSDHATQTRSTQESSSMNSASTTFVAQEDLLIAQSIVFIVFAWAFALGEYAASQEHGWGIYMASVRKYYPKIIIFLSDGQRTLAGMERL